ncbi:MAG TPA: hypothetical protein VI636_23555 [Candidatus Angelobacter sp.]
MDLVRKSSFTRPNRCVRVRTIHAERDWVSVNTAQSLFPGFGTPLLWRSRFISQSAEGTRLPLRPAPAKEEEEFSFFLSGALPASVSMTAVVLRFSWRSTAFPGKPGFRQKAPSEFTPSERLNIQFSKITAGTTKSRSPWGEGASIAPNSRITSL